jgi:SAM-dependent methyltransferase
VEIAANSHGAEERREAERHDRLYRDQRPGNLLMPPSDWERFEGLRDPLDAYHGSVVALGDIRGRNVLDMGCGDGWLSVILAKRGANVWGYDISSSAIETAHQRAKANGVESSTHFEVASAYETPYPEKHFDLVIGQAILHHLGDKLALARELKRVMRPGAKAVFCEPFAASPILQAVRRLVPIRSDAEDDPDQQQMTYRDFDDFRSLFTVELDEFQLLARLDRVVKSRSAVRFLSRVDRRLLRHVRLLRKYARTVVVTLRPIPG